MSNKLAIIDESWYTQLIDDCQSIITERMHNANWERLLCWHEIGTRLLEDENNFTKGGYTIDGLTKRVATSLKMEDKGVSQRTIQYAIVLAKHFPDLNTLPQGKHISWHIFCNEIAPTLSGGERKALPKPKKATEEYINCLQCGSEIMPIKLWCSHCGLVFEIKAKDIRKR